jgi:hypothetical protein
MGNVKIFLCENSLATQEGTDRGLQVNLSTIKQAGGIQRQAQVRSTPLQVSSLFFFFPPPGLVPLCVSFLSCLIRLVLTYYAQVF